MIKKQQLQAGGGIQNRVPEIPQSQSRKYGTGTGNHLQIREWDRDSNAKFVGSGTGTEI